MLLNEFLNQSQKNHMIATLLKHYKVKVRVVHKPIKDYELTPSEISGSTVQINENSPFLDEEFKGEGWKRVIRGSVEEAISMIKNKDTDASE